MNDITRALIRIISSKENYSPKIRRIVVLSDTCPHCEEFIKSRLFKEFLSKTATKNLVAITYEPFIWCGDCNNQSIETREIVIETPAMIDIDTMDIETPMPTMSYIVKELVELGIYSLPRATTSRKEEEKEEKKEEKPRKRTRKQRKKEEFYSRKEEERIISRAASCRNDVCIE